MRALAILIWLLVLGLAALILSTPERAPAVARVLQAPALDLWRPAPVLSSPPLAPVSAVVAEQGAPVAAPTQQAAPEATACARLGLFPDAGWARAVAERLLAPTPAAEAAAMSWHLQAAGRKGYYVVFTGMSLDMLAARMEQRRTALSRLVSFAALPEACAGTN